MAKNKNKRSSGKKSFKEEKTKQKSVIVPQVIRKTSRKTDETPLYKQMLIVCEGETEAGYFKALTEGVENQMLIEVDVLPTILPKEKRKEESSDGYSSLRALFVVALGKMKEKKYDEVWVVTDNDEQNAYKLNQNVIDMVKNQISEEWGNQLKLHQKHTLTIRADEKEEDKERIRYFLHKAEYEIFLKNIFPNINKADINRLVELTEKKRDFDYLEMDRKTLVETDNQTLNKAEQKNLDRIKIAYSAISFEHWLLLHFEYNTTAFYNSKEYLYYFDNKGYFGTIAQDGNFTNKFKKGYYLYDQRKRLKSFFECCENIAIYNSLQLCETYARSQIARGFRYFEVNPYCNIHHLIGALIDVEFLRMDEYNTVNGKYPHQKEVLLEDMSITMNSNISTLECRFKLFSKQSFSQKNIRDAFLLKALGTNGNLSINVTFKNKTPVVYGQGDEISLQIDLSEFEKGNYLFYFDVNKLYPKKGKQLIFFIQKK